VSTIRPASTGTIEERLRRLEQILCAEEEVLCATVVEEPGPIDGSLLLPGSVGPGALPLIPAVFMQNTTAQSIAAGATRQTVILPTVFTDTAGMANTTWNQIIVPAGRWFVLLTANVLQGGSNMTLFIQQWNGSAWLDRGHQGTPVAAQLASFVSVAVLCDTTFGTQFQLAAANSGTSPVQITQAFFHAAVLGRVA
jgi:hypothetical protein